MMGLSYLSILVVTLAHFLVFTAASYYDQTISIPMSLQQRTMTMLSGDNNSTILHDDGASLLQAEGAENDPSRIPLTYDGTFFHGPITVGGRTYQVAFSFAASSIWLFGKGLEQKIGEDGFQHKYYEENPPTTEDEFEVIYLDGSLYRGKMTIDKVEIGGITLQGGKREVGIIDHIGEREDEDDEGVIPNPWTNTDGVVGLGLGTHKPFEHRKTRPPFLNLVSRFNLRPSFSLHFAKDGQSGELIIGDYDDSLFVGDLHFVRVLTPQPPSWVVKLDYLRMGEKKLAKNVDIEVNMASNAMWAPRKIIERLYDMIYEYEGPDWWNNDEDRMTIDCDVRADLPELSFELGGVRYKFDAEEYFPEFVVPGHTMSKRMCTFFMLPSDLLPAAETMRGIVPQQTWCLGLPFLKKYYSVFSEIDGSEGWSSHGWKIGFGELR